MPVPSPQERTLYTTIAGEMRARQIPCKVEYTINVSRQPLRYRQVDLRILIPAGIQMWVEIDGPNHKGKRNKARDVELAALAKAHGATVLHFPLWMAMHHGVAPLIDLILRGESHLGHAEPDTKYRVWDSRYST